MSAAETITSELKEEMVPLTEVNVEPEKEDKLETEAAKTEDVQVPEESEAAQAPTLDSEESSCQSPKEEEVISEDIAPAETVTDEPKETAEHVQEPEVLEAVQAPTTDSEVDSVQSVQKEVMSEDVPEEGTVIDEPKEETMPLSEVTLEPVDASKTEDVQVPEESEAVEASTLDSEESSVQSPKEEEVISEDIPPAETVTDEPKETAEHVQEPEVLEAVQAPTTDSEQGNVQSIGKEVMSEDVPEEGTVIDEHKEETILEVSLEPVDASKTEDVQLSETSEAVQASTLDSEESSVQSPKEEVISEDIAPAETDKDEPKETAEHVQEPEVLEAVQAPTTDSEQGNVQSVEKEVMSEDVPEEGTVTDEPKEETILEVSPEPVDASKTEDVQISEESEAVEASTLDSEKSSVQSPKEVISEDIAPAETVTDEPKETAEHVQEPEVLEAVQAPTTDSEEGKDTVKSEDSAPAEMVTDEPKQTAEQLNEVSAEAENKQLPVNFVKTEQDLESEVLEAVPEDIPAVETITSEPKKEDEPVEAAETDIQESKVLPSDELKTETKTVEEVPMQVVTESTEEGSAQEDVPKSDNNNASTLVTDETASEVVAQLVHEITEDQKTESTPQDVTIKQEDCIPEVADELPALTAVHVSSVNEEASRVTVLGEAVISGETSAPCLDNAAVTDEPEFQLSSVQVNEGQEKQGALPGTEMKTATAEHAVVAQVVVCNIKDVPAAIPDVLIEKTSDVTEPSIDAMASQLAFKEEVEAAAPLVTNDVAQTAKEGSVVMMMHVPSVTFEDNHRIQVQVVDVDVKSAETIVDSVLEVGVTETKEVIDVCHETLEKVDDLSATPETEKEVFHEVTVQEVIQHVKENLPETVSESVPQQEVIIQPDAVTKQTETQDSSAPAVSTADSANDRQVSEKNLPETVSESVPVNLEQEEALREKQDEASAVIIDDSAKDRQVSEDLTRATDVAEGLDVSIHDHKVDLEETKTEQEKPEAVTAEEVKPSEAQIAQIVPSPISGSNAGLVVPQNTGIISSIGNVESPSSLSLEFKLNIQFGQAKAPASPPPTTERPAPVKQTDVSEVGVQAVEEVEPVNPINPTETANVQKKTELTEASVQATESTEPVRNLDSTETAVITAQPVLLDVGIQAMEPANTVEQIKTSETVTSSVQATETTEPAEKLDLTERALIMTQPVQLDVGSQAMETVEPVEQIKSTERVTSTVQATETTQPVRPAEKRELILSQPVLFETCDQEIKAEQPVKQTEEENEQDVWMDAEEGIYTQEETEQSFVEVEEPQEPLTASEEQAGPELEIAPDSKTEEEESRQEMNKTGGTCEIESEAEDFAVAPEHQEVSSTSVSTMEWD
ncbi:Zonadhesin [Nibea albiflora]|uniref:Zonadhesin n=1 Tax=Nibea albiflora TaxID=240163 RepID=A0ACB7FFB2_NIBAL|nr:Zonadhesin [Nibea albiflora]